MYNWKTTENQKAKGEEATAKKNLNWSNNIKKAQRVR